VIFRGTSSPAFLARVEAGGEGTAAFRHVHPGAIPSDTCHEVVAEDGDIQLPHVAWHGLVFRNILVSTGQAEFNAGHVDVVTFQGV